MNPDIILAVAEKLNNYDDLVKIAMVNRGFANLIKMYKVGLSKKILVNMGVCSNCEHPFETLKEINASKKKLLNKGYEIGHIPPEDYTYTWGAMNYTNHNYYLAIVSGNLDIAKALFPVVKKQKKYLMVVADVLASEETSPETLSYFNTYHHEYSCELLERHICTFGGVFGTEYFSPVIDFYIKNCMQVLDQTLGYMYMHFKNDEILFNITDYIIMQGGILNNEMLAESMDNSLYDEHITLAFYLARHVDHIYWSEYATDFFEN